MQPTGSFELRGVQRACTAEAAKGARRLLIASSGNAGVAVAYCARELGLACLVVVPESTVMQIKVTLRNLGAQVLARGKTIEDAEAVLQAVRESDDGLIHPLDSPAMVEGYASLIKEAKMQMPDPDAVVVAVGGGGLMSGVLQGMHFVGWGEVPLIACETFGAHPLALAMATGHPVKLPESTSVTGALRASSVSDTAFEWTRRHKVLSEVVTDLEAVRAARDYADFYHRVIDVSCGALIAAIRRQGIPELKTAREILVVICGGMGTSYKDLIRMEEVLCDQSARPLNSPTALPERYPLDITGLLRGLPPH